MRRSTSPPASQTPTRLPYGAAERRVTPPQPRAVISCCLWCSQARGALRAGECVLPLVVLPGTASHPQPP